MISTRGFFPLVILLLVMGGCRCNRGGLQGLELGFRVDDQTVDFGRVIEGAQVVRRVEVFNDSRTEITVSASTEGPFQALQEVVVSAGGSAEVSVTFSALVGISNGKLILTLDENSAEIPLRGEGVKALTCVASSPCTQSRFDLDLNACVETPSPEGGACTPLDVCLENGVCRAGECVGTPRVCDDSNACTTDACADGLGCVHTPIVCPSPQGACRVATCDPTEGCGDAPAQDLTSCGSLDCVTSNLCFGGACMAVDTPDGIRCSPPTPCQGAGVCRSQVCVRPDAGELAYDYSIALQLSMTPLPSASLTPVGDRLTEPVLLAHQSNLFWQMCAPDTVDAGCFLASYTGSGFQRFFSELPREAGARLAQVSDAGVLLVSEAGFSLRHGGTGAPVASFPFASFSPPFQDAGVVWKPVSSPARIARLGAEDWVATLDWFLSPPPDDAGVDAGSDAGLDAGESDAGESDAGEEDGGPGDAGPGDAGGADAGIRALFHSESWVSLGVDGGFVQRALPGGADGGGSVLAVASPNKVAALNRVGSLRWTDVSDAGVFSDWVSGPQYAASGSLSTLPDRTLVGGRFFHSYDGGTALDLGLLDGGQVVPLDSFALLASNRAFLFDLRCQPALQSCPEPQQLAYVRALNLVNGNKVWEAPLYPADAGSQLIDAVVAEGNAVLTLSGTGVDAGNLAAVQLWVDGNAAYTCPLPGNGRIGGSVFSRGFLYVLVEREGVWRLESYDLLTTPMSTEGWPSRFGVSGQRRSNP